MLSGHVEESLNFYRNEAKGISGSEEDSDAGLCAPEL